MRPYNISSALQKVLGFQAAFRSTFNFQTYRAMSVSTMETDVNRTLSYWFDGENPQKKWFAGGPQVDAEIKENFGSLIEKARASELSSWTVNPRGTLALIVLLDQFSRNIYRGKAEAFSADPLALEIATMAIAKRFDREVPQIQQSFFYLPMMHSETLIAQVAVIALYESLVARCEDPEIKKHMQMSVEFGEKHRDCILKFGRFPSRNEALGRFSTPEEIEYLKEHPSGF